MPCEHDHQMEYTADDILVLLPVGAALATSFRTIVGVPLIGVFAPALLALTVLELGARNLIAATAVAVGAGLMAAPFVERLALPRPSRLGLLLVAVAAAVVGTNVLDGQQGVMPLVVLAIATERVWETTRSEGGLRALQLGGYTLGSALAIAAILGALVPTLSGRSWLFSTVVGIAATVAAGSYRGLRLTEFWRFSALVRPPRGGADSQRDDIFSGVR